jgi:hypothetical protein
MVSANVLFFLRVGELRVLTTMGSDTRPHRSDEKGRWVYGLDHNGDRGKVKGLKDNAISLTLTTSNAAADVESLPGIGRPCVFAAFGYGAEGSVVGETAHSPLQSDSPVRPQQNRGYTKRQKTGR